LGSRLISVVEDSTKGYKSHTPLDIKVKIELEEVDIRVIGNFIQNYEVVCTTSSWIPHQRMTQDHESSALEIH
jgi:hypothetical protein